MIKPSSLVVITGLTLNLAGAALMCSRLFGVEIELGKDTDSVSAGAGMAIAGLFTVVAGVALARRAARLQRLTTAVAAAPADSQT